MRRTARTFRRALGAALVLGMAMLGAPDATGAEAEQETEVRDWEVPFLTLRNLTDEEEPGERYGGDRSDLKAGTCGVREIDLGFLPPLAGSVPSFLKEELLRVETVREAETGALLEALQSATARPVVYVHGYFISFEKGCRRAALLQENAGLGGRLLWFSWPSDGLVSNYTRDESDLYWSVPDLADAIAELAARFGGRAVSVAGHSLGARGVALALYELANRSPGIRLGDVVLLAPDIDFAIFERLLPRIVPIVETMTVYVTSGDRPLALSAQLHGYPRLGEAGNDVSRLEGVEVIDLSDLPVESPTGHLYHIYSAEVGADLDQLLNEGRTAAARRNLVRAGGNIWRLQEAEDEAEDEVEDGAEDMEGE